MFRSVLKQRKFISGTSIKYSGFRNKTPITQELWERRIKENELRNEKEATEAPSFIIPKNPKESQQTIEVIIN